ncbi:hypothetical protein GCM10027568_27090 [Humibacter soli]
MADAIPAGWYPNPWNDGEELYWSGSDWTGISRTAHRRDAEAPVVAAPATSTASDLEESTVMRPVGAATAFEPVAYAAPAPYAAPDPYSPGPDTYSPEPQYASPQYSAAPRYPTPDATSIRWALSSDQPQQPVRRHPHFGLVSMIVGIAAAVCAIIPGLSLAAWIPAFVAIPFGIVAFLGGRPRGFALTGIITGGAALAVGTAVSIWFIVQLGVLAH